MFNNIQIDYLVYSCTKQSEHSPFRRFYNVVKSKKQTVEKYSTRGQQVTL